VHPPPLTPASQLQASQLQARRRIAAEPRWRPQAQFTCATLAPGLRAWLTDNGSLTARLTDCGRGEFAVQRLNQSWEVPLPSERTLLDLPARQLALVREVALTLDGTPVVFARSVFPISSLTGSLAHLRRLQNKSLGAILFSTPGMHRCAFELALMAGDCDYLPANLQQGPPAWGRRSRFETGGKRLLVSEVFLQAFTPWQRSLPSHRTQRGKVSASVKSRAQSSTQSTRQSATQLSTQSPSTVPTQ
jgi:chorismate--pyruvate lyase